jgi:hypothetical protein
MFRHESAKIYEFPRRARATADGQHEGNKPAVDLRSQQAPVVEFGSGWYHEAAIQDAERTRKP